MGRGIFTGLVWGAVVGFAILVFANEVVAPVGSVISEAPGPQAPPRSATPEAASPEAGTAEADPEAGSPDAAPEPAPAGTGAPGSATPAPELERPADLAPPEADEAPALAPDLPAGEAARTGGLPEVTAPEASSETAPAAEDSPAAAPEVSPVDPRETPEEAGGLDMGAIGGQSPVLTPPQSVAPEAAAPDALPSVEEHLPGRAPAPEGTEAPPAQAVVPGTEMPEEPATGPRVTAMPGVGAADRPGRVETQEAQDSPEGRIGQRAGSFTDREDSRRSTRLPAIGGEAAGGTGAPVVLADELPALTAYSADFSGAPEGPMMSVILVDIARLEPEDPAFASLPFPVALAVDAVGAGAGAGALAYRGAGLEVLSMVALPEGASPQDAAVTLSQAADLVPVSIGFLDVPSASFQSSRQVAAQVVASAGQSGRGIVSFPRGLNALEQEAQRADEAPMALVFRDFDGRGQDVDAMKRFLDQAAFHAGIDGKVVLVGRAKPDTLRALAEWAIGTRASSVSIVPLSYLLTR
ncbi:divergent polysaccharide deacetylase family protein [Celeribacter indicus]|uniref:Divergent polysaccharide deacetylase n=1 Tax=Celeribacter indicus TaxID=1208324 RepID=A0A0B5E1H9_9RHOB|nr:divergent polysaccharide deacetylase family protein [Celeribacter indicus]AJE46317.1 hypothetical protein P73_1602 [Celeribacter indicus]SDW53178.1 Uncharacterized conserved protein YibQ, putative polysaccharide deacetylase 2 family [Celeribacter indicus]